MAERDPADEYEDALKECGFGMFNIVIFLAVFCSVCSLMFSTTVVSYVAPVADCDLGMSAYEKGLVMGIIYVGMIVGAIPLGFCADVYGRRPLLVIGHFVDALLAILAGFSQTSTQLIIAKFFQGLVVCGPYAAAIAYLSEVHTKYLRAIAIMISGVFITLSLLIIPIMAYFIIPSHNTIKIGELTLYNWNFYLLYMCLPSLFVCFVYFFLPESPKFLLSKGRKEEAVKVIGKIYDLNKPCNKGSCPVKSFSSPEAAEVDPEEKFCARAGRRIVEGLRQVKTLFSKQYFLKTLLVCTMLLTTSWVLHSMRLWFPQMFYTLSELKKKDEDFKGVCMVVEYVQSNPKPPKDCNRENGDAHNYFLTIMHNLVWLIIYCFMVIIVKYVESRAIIIAMMLWGLMFTAVFYFSFTPLMVMIVSAFFISGVGIVTTVMLTVAVSIFPTQVRAMIVILILTIGRIGSSIGNVVVPHIIAGGCIPLFVQLGAFQLVTLVFAMFIPKTKNVAIK